MGVNSYTNRYLCKNVALTLPMLVGDFCHSADNLCTHKLFDSDSVSGRIFEKVNFEINH